MPVPERPSSIIFAIRHSLPRCPTGFYSRYPACPDYPPAHRILIDRYSPYYRTPETLGIHKVTAGAHYRALYPPEVPTADVAYHFDGAYSTELLDQPELVARLDAAIADWHKAWRERPPLLQLLTVGEAGVVLDTRPIARAPMTPLTAGQHAALLRLERPVERAALDREMVEDAEWLVDRDFAIDHEGKLLSLVVRPRAASEKFDRHGNLAMAT